MKARRSKFRYCTAKWHEVNVGPEKCEKGIRLRELSWTVAEFLYSPSAVTLSYDPQKEGTESM